MRLFRLALELPHLRVGLADSLRNGLGFQHLRLGERDLRLRLPQSRRGSVDFLLGRRLFWQAPLALIVGLRPDLSRLRRGELGLRLLQQSGKIFAGDFGAECLAGELRFRGVQHAFGDCPVVLILPRIDMDERLALADELIVGHVEGHDLARDLRRDIHGTPVDKGVVGRYNVAVGNPIINAGSCQQSENGDSSIHDERPPIGMCIRGRCRAGG